MLIDDRPAPGIAELWAVEATDGPRHGIYLGDGTWNVLIRRFSEYTLHQVDGLKAVSLLPVQPQGRHWEQQFDALARAEGLGTTWAQEISRYRVEGLQRGITAVR